MQQPSSTPRERVGAAQVELLYALLGGGPVPRGFDPAGTAAEAGTLASKRRCSVAKARPALMRALGSHFGEYFAAYARACPRPVLQRDDSAAFTRWFRDRLGDEDVVERIEWHVGLRALIAASGARGQGHAALSREVKADLDQLQELLNEVRRRRGPRATEEPRLKTALVLASLRTLGVELDASTRAIVRAELVLALTASKAGASASTVRDGALAVLGTNLAIERVLSLHLTVDQQERYHAHTGDDPFFDQNLPRWVLAGSNPEALGEQLASHWVRIFELSAPAALAAARAVACRYASEAAPLASKSLPVSVGRRQARFEREVRLVEVQGRAEKELAAHPALPAPERARIESRIGSFVIEVR